MDDINLDDLPMGEVVTVSERTVGPELRDEVVAKYRHPGRNPGNVERERLADLLIARREGRA